jgi:hypothetical protein
MSAMSRNTSIARRNVAGPRESRLEEVRRGLRVIDEFAGSRRVEQISHAEDVDVPLALPRLRRGGEHDAHAVRVQALEELAPCRVLRLAQGFHDALAAVPHVLAQLLARHDDAEVAEGAAPRLDVLLVRIEKRPVDIE